MSDPSVLEAARVGFRPVNADELLSRLVARDIAQEVTPSAGSVRAVRFKHIEVAAAAESGERYMRARWRERVGNSAISYLLITDDSENEGSVLTLGPREAQEPIRSVDCASLAADCRARGARYGILVCRSRYRLLDCDPSASTAEWLDLDADLLGEARRPYLALLAPSYLAEGRLADLQADAKAFGAALLPRK